MSIVIFMKIKRLIYSCKSVAFKYMKIKRLIYSCKSVAFKYLKFDAICFNRESCLCFFSVFILPSSISK